jgi:hypothetical protein
MNDVHKIVVEVARPRPPHFHGRIEVGYYVVVEGSVVLTDEQGRPIGERVRIGNGDPRGIACSMLRRRRKGSFTTDFDSPISYRRSKYL